MIFDLQHQLRLLVYAACNEEEISPLVTRVGILRGLQQNGLFPFT